MNCPICKKSEWKNVDEFRIKPSGMCMCTSCGFVSYPEIVAKADNLKEYYREEYRDVPGSMNVFSGQRKLHYHNEFLADLFKSWASEGLTNPMVCEVGAAFGMFLNWVKTQFPKAQLHGTELTLSFRRNAWHEYGIKLDEEFDSTLQYDLITSYKVAEHIPLIDQELRKYALALNPKGLLYISVPCWFGAMTNFGMTGFSIEYYYSKNHINVWTKKHFETLLSSCGLEIVKENHIFYDSTYLCKRNDKLMTQKPEYEDPAQVLVWLDKIKKASLAHDSQNFAEACKHWPDFPESQIAKIEFDRSKNHKQGYEAIQETHLKALLDACPNSFQARMYCADISMRYSKWENAIQYLQQALEMKPSDPSSLMSLSNCFRNIANASTDVSDKVKFFTEARNVTRFLKQTSLQTVQESMNWIMNDNARIPMPGEKPL